MRLLYLDLATNSGWAAGDVSGPPVFGTETMPKGTGRNLGLFGIHFEDWLYRMIADHMPGHIAFESPFLGGGLNLDTTRKLTGLCFVTEMACAREGIGVSETQYSDVRKWAYGHAKPGKWADKEKRILWKEHMKRAAIARGHDVRTYDEADAVMGWEYTAHRMWPDLTPHLVSFKDIREPQMEGV